MNEQSLPVEVVKNETSTVTSAMNKERIKKAQTVLKKYKEGKKNLEERIKANEQWYKLRHWEQSGLKTNASEPYPTSAWLFNSIANKHADAMDNYPEPAILPREESDKQEAEALTSILPLILEQNEFEETYSDAWWYKLKSGTAVYGVFWNPKKLNGLGDIEIKPIDLLNLFWEPGIKNIQDSRNLFNIELVDKDVLKEMYPQLDDKMLSDNSEVSKYEYDDSVDTTEKAAVIDWYYKKRIGDTTVLHYCKFTGENVLYSSEEDPMYKESGFYNHGLYPFVFDPLFVVEGTPAGFGYIDIMKSPQMMIDKLDQAILKNVLQSSKRRYFIRDDGSVNEEEFANFENDFVHVTGSNLGEDSIREIKYDSINSIAPQIKQMKVEELKETSGNRDFSQGSTTSGVTAASAIAALQEAGSKLSRDMLKSAYRAFAQINRFCIELIRQFYDEPRYFRILGESGMQFITYSNANLRPQMQGDIFGVSGYRFPEFDIKIKAQKASTFSKLAQNELAKELYGLGFFNPQISDQALLCIDMMDFEGKQQIVNKISQNGTMYQQIQQLVALVRQMAGGMPSVNGVQTAQPPQTNRKGTIETDSLGNATLNTGNSTADKARERVNNATNPQL